MPRLTWAVVFPASASFLRVAGSVASWASSPGAPPLTSNAPTKTACQNFLSIASPCCFFDHHGRETGQHADIENIGKNQPRNQVVDMGPRQRAGFESLFALGHVHGLSRDHEVLAVQF